MRCSLLACLLAAVACTAPRAAHCAVAILFEHQNFEGQRLAVRDAMPNLDRTTFNDRAESMLIRDGVWEVCTDAYYRGHCVRLGPGEYRSLDGELTRRISSLREVRGAPPPGPRAPLSGRPHALLYSDPGFGGRELLLEDPVVPNLEDFGFNDRAASLKIVGGSWLFCTDANFRGRCRTLGPGDYARLPGDIANRISSARRVEQPPAYEAPPYRQH
ncbi:MAG TPA: beta/gamma crystallin family protein [Casimicrobiaceae bacterium]|nr:beta/gamma crystallin family protein [Casimicrobiaceae bacterium]